MIAHLLSSWLPILGMFLLLLVAWVVITASITALALWVDERREAWRAARRLTAGWTPLDRGIAHGRPMRTRRVLDAAARFPRRQA